MESRSEKSPAGSTVAEEGEMSQDPPMYPGLPELRDRLEASEQVVIPGYSHINLGKYHIPDSTISPDRTTVTILSKELSSNPAALEAFLEEQMKLPPRPTVRIIGRINNPIPIFDLRLDLFRHITPSAERNGMWAHTKVSGMDDSAAPLRPDEKSALFSGAPDVTGAGFWIRRFCTDTTQPVRK